ncbi:MAG TPA: Vms1/Ankzf1 family peptidyl-tRNA hydrolase, partial [Vulgatibacter sp.]
SQLGLGVVTILAGHARGGDGLTPFQAELQELAGLRSDRDPIVSMYLDTRWSDPAQRVRVRLFVENNLASVRASAAGPWRDALERTLQRIEAYVEGLWRQAYEVSDWGTAIFACDGLGLWRTYGFRHRMQDELSVGPTPDLLQLARFSYDYRPTILAVIDSHGTWIFETALGDVIGEVAIDHGVHRRHEMGGWSQFRFQRRIENQIARNLAEGADHVTFLADENPRRRVVLAGTAREVAMFEKALPTRVRERIIARLPGPAERSYQKGEIRDDMIRGAIAELFDRERDRETGVIRRVVSEALAGGLAEIGPEDVVLAANEGRIHRLVIQHGLEMPGWRCTNCDSLGIKHASTCSYCGYPAEDVPLSQELANRVLREGGRVDVVEPDALLHHYYGVAAVLRHRGARANIGAAAEPLYY